MQDPYANIEYLYLDNSTKKYTEEGNVKWDIPEITVNDGEYFYLQLQGCKIGPHGRGFLVSDSVVLIEKTDNYKTTNEHGFPVMAIMGDFSPNFFTTDSDDNPIVKISKPISSLTFKIHENLNENQMRGLHSGTVPGFKCQMILKIIRPQFQPQNYNSYKPLTSSHRQYEKLVNELNHRPNNRHTRKLVPKGRRVSSN